MTYDQAIEIINKNRIESPFTMGLSLNEFIEDFRKRYLRINNMVLSSDYIDIAMTMLSLDGEWSPSFFLFSK